jgi:hypothetical protein
MRRVADRPLAALGRLVIMPLHPWKIERYPRSWRTSVTISRGGLDRHGDQIAPDEVIEVDDVIIGWGETADVPRSDTPEDVAVMYLPINVPDLWATDLVDVPLDNEGPSGLFQVVGTPRRFPLGVQIALRKV